MKQCEQELNQLREKSIEQTRSLRSANRQVEQIQAQEKLLNDEIQQLKTQLEKEKSHLTTIQVSNCVLFIEKLTMASRLKFNKI